MSNQVWWQKVMNEGPMHLPFVLLKLWKSVSGFYVISLKNNYKQKESKEYRNKEGDTKVKSSPLPLNMAILWEGWGWRISKILSEAEYPFHIHSLKPWFNLFSHLCPPTKLRVWLTTDFPSLATSMPPNCSGVLWISEVVTSQWEVMEPQGPYVAMPAVSAIL